MMKKILLVCLLVVLAPTAYAFEFNSENEFDGDGGGGGGGSTSGGGGGGDPIECPPLCQEATEVNEEACGCGTTGLIRKQRTANVSNVCGTNSAWTEVSNTCATITTQRDNPVRILWQPLTSYNKSALQSSALANNCPPGWTPTELIDDRANSRHHIGEEDTDGGRAQLCIKTSDESVTMTSEWVTGACPSGMIDTGVRDDQGNSGDPRYRHELNEESHAGIDSYWRWCLGVNSPSTLSLRWIQNSGKSPPPCATGETGLIEGKSGKRNINSEDVNGKNQERFCAKVTTPASSACPAVAAGDPMPQCGGGVNTCVVGTVGNQNTGSGFSSWTCTSGSEVRNCSVTTQDDGEDCGTRFCSPSDL